ncbi:MAG TPA: hypothetical protein VJ207_03740 [Thermoplasmata archaeon]|nr:hypothetical protein [Thermoplasmata archaeon]
MDFARVNRKITAGKHPLTKVFPGLDVDTGFKRLFANNGARQEVLAKCYIETARENLDVDPAEYVVTQLRELDTERFTQDAMAALGTPTEPFIKRFTRRGYEPQPL